MTRKEYTYKQWLNNHRVDDDGVIEKQCSKCKDWLEENEDNFYLMNKKNPDKGFQSECRECAKERSLTNRNENIERSRASWRKWYKQEGNVERIKEYNRAYYEADPQIKLKIAKEFRQNFPEIVNGYTANRSHKNHNINNKEWFPCKDYFKDKDGKWACAYCGRTEEESYRLYNCQLHKEHVIFDGENNLSNCVPSCQECNSEKHIFALDDWYNSDNIKYSIERYNKIQKWLQEDHKKYIDLNKKTKQMHKKKSE